MTDLYNISVDMTKQSATHQSQPNSQPEFDGKVVKFFTSKAAMVGEDDLLLDTVVFQEQGGRLFVKGHTTQINGSSEHIVDIEVAIAWDEVVYYLVFPSRDDYLGHSRLYPMEKPVVRKGKSLAGVFVMVVSVGILVCIFVALILWIFRMLHGA